MCWVIDSFIESNDLVGLNFINIASYSLVSETSDHNELPGHGCAGGAVQ